MFFLFGKCKIQDLTPFLSLLYLQHDMLQGVLVCVIVDKKNCKNRTIKNEKEGRREGSKERSKG